MIGLRNVVCVMFFLFFGIACQKEQAATEKVDSATDAFPLEGTAAESAVHIIEIKQMQFEPAEIHVKKGDEVRWINKDITNHDVTEQSSKAWASSPLATGESWSMVATETADYYCDLHQVMKGRIVVE